MITLKNDHSKLFWIKKLLHYFLISFVSFKTPYIRRKYEIDWPCKLLTINNNNSSQFFVYSTRYQTQDLFGLGQHSIIELHTKSGFAEKRKGLTTQCGLECIM